MATAEVREVHSASHALSGCFIWHPLHDGIAFGASERGGYLRSHFLEQPICSLLCKRICQGCVLQLLQPRNVAFESNFPPEKQALGS
jgi:hypothetical protein